MLQVIIMYLYTLHNVEFCASYTCIGAIEQWAWHWKVNLGEGRDDAIFSVDPVGSREQSTRGTATQDILLSRTGAEMISRVGLSISVDERGFFSLFNDK